MPINKGVSADPPLKGLWPTQCLSSLQISEDSNLPQHQNSNLTNVYLPHSWPWEMVLTLVVLNLRSVTKTCLSLLIYILNASQCFFSF